MALLAHLDLATLAQAPVVAGPLTGTEAAALSAAGNWGYTTASGRRFALTGLSTGTSIVEVTDAAHPRSVALVAGPDSQWREIRTYGEYVYTTTEAPWGLDIISMKDPDHPRKIQTWNKTFRTAHSLWIDTDRGLLFVNGSNGRAGIVAVPILKLLVACPASLFDISSVTRLPIILADHSRPVAPVLPLYGQ